jgi:hypothetical protein
VDAYFAGTVPPLEVCRSREERLARPTGSRKRSIRLGYVKVASPRTPAVDQFRKALRSGDLTQVRTLLESDSEVRAAVNAPIGSFGGRPVGMVRDNLPMVDLLLSYGADLNLKSDWWAGGFGLLEYGCTPEQAAPLIARGAVVDIFAAANLGMLDRVRELVNGDPAVVHARGGDGKTALHCASTVAIATWLIDHGAEIDAKCVDHESTAAQYLVRDHPAIARLLIDRGAWFDIFIAVGLRDLALVERCLHDDPDALNHRIWRGSIGRSTLANDLPLARKSAIIAATFIGGCSITTSARWMLPTGLAMKTSSRCSRGMRRPRNACWPRVGGPSARPLKRSWRRTPTSSQPCSLNRRR